MAGGGPSLPSQCPLGIPLVSLSQLGRNNYVTRGSIIYGMSNLSWIDINGSAKRYVIRNASSAEQGWTRLAPYYNDFNDMPPGWYTLGSSMFRMYNVPERYDGGVRIQVPPSDETSRYYQPRPYSKAPHVIKLQSDRMPMAWSAYSDQDIQSTCSLPANIYVEVYKIPFRFKSQDIDRYQLGQNVWMSSGAKLVCTLRNMANSVAIRGYPNPIISEVGIPTLYLDVYGWEPGLYVDIWHNYAYDAEVEMRGTFEISEMMDIPSFSEEMYWVQPVLYPGGIPRDARRFPVGVALAVKGDAKIDKAFWQTRFNHISPHITIMMRNPLTQYRDEKGNKLDPYKERYLQDITGNRVGDGVDGLEPGTGGTMDYIYFNRRFKSMWWRYWDAHWFAGGTDNKWLGDYIVDIFFYIDWGLYPGCGMSQPVHTTQHGFRCDWALTRHSQPNWYTNTSPGDDFIKMIDFNIQANQYNSNQIAARDSYKILKPNTCTSYRTLFSE